MHDVINGDETMLVLVSKQRVTPVSVPNELMSSPFISTNHRNHLLNSSALQTSLSGKFLKDCLLFSLSMKQLWTSFSEAEGAANRALSNGAIRLRDFHIQTPRPYSPDHRQIVHGTTNKHCWLAGFPRGKLGPSSLLTTIPDYWCILPRLMFIHYLPNKWEIVF